MKTLGRRDENGLSEYVRFREVVKWCYKQAVSSTPPERVDLVVPRVEEVRRGLKTRFDVEEKTLMLQPGEVIWYDGERSLWDETKQVLKQDALKECTKRACQMIDLKKIPLLVLIKIIEPMDIFPSADVADAVRAHALDTHFRLQESLEDPEVEQHSEHLPKRPRSNLLYPSLAQHEQNKRRDEDDSQSSDSEMAQEGLTRRKFGYTSINPSAVGKRDDDSRSSDAEMDLEGLTGKKVEYSLNPPAAGETDYAEFWGIRFANCIRSSDEEDDDAFLRKYFPNCTTPSEDEADHATKKPTSATHGVDTDQESTDDEYHDGTQGPTSRAQRTESPNKDYNDGTQRSTSPAECSFDSGRFDLYDPDQQSGRHVRYCCYS